MDNIINTASQVIFYCPSWPFQSIIMVKITVFTLVIWFCNYRMALNSIRAINLTKISFKIHFLTPSVPTAILNIIRNHSSLQSIQANRKARFCKIQSSLTILKIINGFCLGGLKKVTHAFISHGPYISMSIWGIWNGNKWGLMLIFL